MGGPGAPHHGSGARTRPRTVSPAPWPPPTGSTARARLAKCNAHWPPPLGRRAPVLFYGRKTHRRFTSACAEVNRSAACSRPRTAGPPRAGSRWRRRSRHFSSRSRECCGRAACRRRAAAPYRAAITRGCRRRRGLRAARKWQRGPRAGAAHRCGCTRAGQRVEGARCWEAPGCFERIELLSPRCCGRRRRGRPRSRPITPWSRRPPHLPHAHLSGTAAITPA